MLILRTLVAVFLFLPLWSQGASFDCAKKKQDIEYAICKDDALGTLDALLADSYATLLKMSNPNDAQRVKQAQRAWLAERNGQCVDLYQCMEAHARRLVDIKQQISPMLLSEKIARYKTMNDLAWDSDFQHFTRGYFGGMKVREYNRDFLVADNAENALGGPPEDLQKIGNIVVGMACQAHSCPNKGIFVFDVVSRDALYGISSFTDAAGQQRPGSTVLVYYKNEQFLREHKDLLERNMAALAGPSTFITVKVP
jgi:uncharacterized protein